MNCKQIIAVSAVVLFALMLVPVADAATIENSPSGTVEVDNMNGGGFDFTLQSDNSFELTVTITENGRELSVQTFNVTPGENVIHVDLGMMTSVGNHTIRVECTPANEMEGGHGFNVNVEVTQNILSNWAVYGAIAVVVIIIVIFAYIKMRDTPKVKPEMTFEELEAQEAEEGEGARTHHREEEVRRQVRGAAQSCRTQGRGGAEGQGVQTPGEEGEGAQDDLRGARGPEAG